MTKFLLLVGRVVFVVVWPFWRWYFPRHPRTRLLMVCGDEVLVVRGWLGDGKWSLPGGGLHRGEDPVEAVCREVREEVGIDIDEAACQSLGTCGVVEKGIRTTYYAFGLLLAEKPTIRRQWYEIAETAWLRIEDIENEYPAQATRAVIALWKKRT